MLLNKRRDQAALDFLDQDVMQRPAAQGAVVVSCDGDSTTAGIGLRIGPRSGTNSVVTAESLPLLPYMRRLPSASRSLFGAFGYRLISRSTEYSATRLASE